LNVQVEVIRVVSETLGLGDRGKTFDESTRLLGAIPELDSMAVVSVLTTIEETFDVTIDDDEISAETFESVGSLTRFIEAKLES